MAGGGEQVDSIEIEGAGEGEWVGFRGQPFAGVLMQEGMAGVWGEAMEGLGEELFASARFAFKRRDLEARSCDFGLKYETAQSCAHAHELLSVLGGAGA